MRDHTGENWLAHFLNGTGTLLRLQGPDFLGHQDKRAEHCQTFFFSARIFEISRALIYTRPTFLAAPEWSTAIEAYWTRHVDTWTPKEILFDMLPRFVDLAMRTLDFVDQAEINERPGPEQDQRASSLAQEGLLLRSVLLHLYMDSLLPASLDNQDKSLEILLASVYYHTISIYLDGVFSYHMPFTAAHAPASPILDRTAIGDHVANILNLSQELLAQGTAGILLFFPLRVAGARASNHGLQTKILILLHTIVQRGFMVASSFVEDLNRLWVQR